MRIESTYAQITTSRDGDEKESFMNVRQAISGFAFKMDLYGTFLLCKEPGCHVPVIVAVPSERWNGDVRDSGIEIIGVIDKDGIKPAKSDGDGNDASTECNKKTPS